MTGLSLGVGANVRAGQQVRAGSVPNPTTASAAAFGPGLNVAAQGSALLPNNPGGIAFWIGVGGFLALAAIYYTLPG